MGGFCCSAWIVCVGVFEVKHYVRRKKRDLEDAKAKAPERGGAKAIGIGIQD